MEGMNKGAAFACVINFDYAGFDFSSLVMGRQMYSSRALAFGMCRSRLMSEEVCVVNFCTCAFAVHWDNVISIFSDGAISCFGPVRPWAGVMSPYDSACRFIRYSNFCPNMEG